MYFLHKDNDKFSKEGVWDELKGSIPITGKDMPWQDLRPGHGAEKLPARSLQELGTRSLGAGAPCDRGQESSAGS